MAAPRQRVAAHALTIVAAVVIVLASDGTTTMGSPLPQRRCVGLVVQGRSEDRVEGVPDPSSLSLLLTRPRGGDGGGREDGWHFPRRRISRGTSRFEALSRLVRRSVIGRDDQAPAHDDDDHDGGEDASNREPTVKRHQGSGLRQITLPDLNLENFLRIDFSGDLDCHLLGHAHHHPPFESTASAISGPRPKRASSAAPLIRSRHPWTPNWIVGVHYDFANCWYGATRAWSHVQCALFPPPPLDSVSPSSFLASPRMLLPVAVDWTTDRSLRDGTDRSNEAALYWKRSVEDRLATSLRGRVESATATAAAAGTSNPAKATLTLQVPLHRRLSYECRLVSDAIPPFLRTWSWLLPPSSTPNDRDDPSVRTGGRGGFRLPDVTRMDDEGWWLPDVTLSASGHIESRNAAVLPHPRRLYDGRVAVRFTVRRNLLWSHRLEEDDGADDHDDGSGAILLSSASPLTTIGVEIHDMQSHAMNGIVLQTELERPLYGLRMALVQQLYRPP